MLIKRVKVINHYLIGKNIHERFFNECLTSYNEKITSDDLIVCEEFELVYKVD